MDSERLKSRSDQKTDLCNEWVKKKYILKERRDEEGCQREVKCKERKEKDFYLSMFVVLLFGDGGLIVVSHTRKISAGTIHRRKGRRKKKELKNMMKMMMIMTMKKKKKKKKKRSTREGRWS